MVLAKRIAFLLIAPVALLAAAGFAFEQPSPPQALLGDLYVDVELARVFPDSKEFADATPKLPPADILALYHDHAQKPLSPEALKRFVVEQFDLPTAPAAPAYSADPPPIRQHIDALWERLTRFTPAAAPYSSLLPLPKPYVVPGGRFRELYYWDSYFTMLGLAESGRNDLLEDMVRNFASLIDTYGHVPNGTRTYYLTRSQPPFFYAMVGASRADGPRGGLCPLSCRSSRPNMRSGWKARIICRQEAAHRRVIALQDGSMLNRYWDDSDAPRDESYREDVALGTDLAPRSASDLSRHPRRSRERLGFQLALVRRPTQSRRHRHHRDHSGRSE